MELSYSYGFIAAQAIEKGRNVVIYAKRTFIAAQAIEKLRLRR